MTATAYPMRKILIPTRIEWNYLCHTQEPQIRITPSTEAIVILPPHFKAIK